MRCYVSLSLILALGCGGQNAPSAPTGAEVSATPAPTTPAPATPTPIPAASPAPPSAAGPAIPPAEVTPAAASGESPTPAGPREPGTNTPPAARLIPPAVPPAGADPILGAIEPTADAVTLGSEVTLGEARFVLYAVDLGRVATAALRAREHGPDLEGVLGEMIDGCAENGRDRVRCARRYAPDVALVMAEYTSPTGIGIARIEDGAVTARRSLVVGARRSPEMSLSSGDLDGNGSEELTVELDVTFETENGAQTDGEAPTAASGTLVYFLDRDLRTRFRFASRIESNIDGVWVSCRNDYEIRDVNGDGRPDLHLDRSCQDPDATEPATPAPLDCLAEGTRFGCPPLGTFFFDPASPYFAETLEELRARHRDVGRSFSEVQARVRAESEE